MNNNIIKKDNIIYNNNEDEDDFNFKGDKQNEYSYQCVQNLLLSAYIYEGTDQAHIQLVLRNNGEKAWAKGGTKLIYDKKSVVSGDDIIFKPLNPGDIEQCEITLKNLGQFFAGEYSSYLLFYVNGKNYGDKISLKVVIKKKENPKPKQNEDLEKVKEFRYNLLK